MSDDKKNIKVVYQPEVFEVAGLDAAMEVILTPEQGTTTAERWEFETPYLVDQIGRELALNQRPRAVPSNRGWLDDGVSVEDLLVARFDVIARGELPEVVTTPELAAASYTMRLKKRG
jgi:hypothetical protein